MNLKKITALLLSFLAIDKIPFLDGKVNFSEENEAKLKAGLEEGEFEKIVKAFNSEIEANDKVKKVSEEIKALLKDTNLTVEEIQQLARADTSEEEDDNPDAAAVALEANIKLLREKFAAQNTIIEELINGAEDDIPLHRIKGGKMKEAIKHSATHLFGSTKAYDAFEGRPWNKFAAGLTTSATDFSDGSTIDNLNGDMQLFYRENPKAIESLHRDNFGLPSQWDKLMNVVDKVTHATVATAEITQSRKLPWLAKNKQAIKAEVGQIYPISVDAEFIGHLLSVIEASWMSAYNKEGSQAYKISFVRFLVQEIDKQARTEDRIATIKAVYSETPDGATVPGKFINRQNGLLYWLWKARDIDKKYRAFDIGVPTTSNIVDYIDTLIKSLPLEVRRSQGLELQLSPAWRDAYRKRYRDLHGLEQDFKGEIEYPKDFSNIMFQPLVDLEGHDIMVITFSKNVQILENIPKEKSLYKFEYFLRVIYVLADYKIGIRFKHIGAKVAESDPDQFKVQTVWSNSVPIFMPDFFIPVHDDTTGFLDAIFDRLQVDDAWKTNITKVENATPGTVIRIQGNTNLPATKSVTTGSDITLIGGTAFDLILGGTLTCFVKPDGTLTELSRTAAPEEIIEATGLYGSTGVIDADLGDNFTAENTGNIAITGVINGVENKIIKLNGLVGGAFTVSFSTTGNISVASAAVLADENDYIELILVDGVWSEINRVIA